MILAVFFFFLSLGPVWGAAFKWTAGHKYHFALATMVFSILAIILQVGGFIAELSRCGRYAWKLAFNRTFTNLLGNYGSDIMLSILKYKGQRLDVGDSQAGALWKGMAFIMYYLGKIFEWAVFCDPYSGIFQTRYKTNCIYLSEESFGGEGYFEMLESARKKLDDCDPKNSTSDSKGATSDPESGTSDPEIGASDASPEGVGSKDVKLDRLVLVETVKVRSANFMLRYSRVGLHTDSYYYDTYNQDRDDEACTVEVMLYTSQGNNSGGLFHELYGPVQSKRSKVSEVLVLMKLLSNDGFVVNEEPPAKTEALLHCLSFTETMNKILRGESRVNFAMRTGMSFG